MGRGVICFSAHVFNRSPASIDINVPVCYNGFTLEYGWSITGDMPIGTSTSLGIFGPRYSCKRHLRKAKKGEESGR